VGEWGGVMSWNAAMLCVSSSFQVGNSGSHYALLEAVTDFRIVAKVAKNAANFFFTRNPGISEALEDMHCTKLRLCRKIQSCTKPICIKLVSKKELIYSFDPPSDFRTQIKNFISYY
jgi:hypothetical protein